MKEETAFPNPYWLLDKEEDKQTEFVVVLASKNLYDGNITIIYQLITDNDIVIRSTNTLPNNKGIEIFITTTTTLAWRLFLKFLNLVASQEIDIAVLPVSARKKKLLVCDMDSTIVQSETLDDIAESVGIGEQVKAITAKAMLGELDFRQALDERVSLLAGMAENVLDEIAKTVQFNSGAEKLVDLALEQGIRSVLVSGGFEPIVKVVAKRLGFDRCVCNRMEILNGRITGKIVEPIVDGDAKLNVLLEECQQLAIYPLEACAIGDGANDIQMLQAAGLGMGFQGKPLVRASTPYQINSTGLDSALLVMGITG